MPLPRHALAALPATALALATAAPAGAATIQTDACVRYVAGERLMTIVGAGFTPNSFVSIAAARAGTTAPLTFASATALPNGGFLVNTQPPAFNPFNRNQQSFTLVASDSSNPAAPIVATAPFEVVRFGMTRTPTPRRPSSRVTITARGWQTGKAVYMHFRFGGVKRRTVSLGVARGPCGITSKRMRALPTKARYGSWTAYVDQSKRFSLKTRPQWIDRFRIFRTAA